MAWIVGPLTIHRQVGGASCVGLGGGSPTILMGGLGGSQRAMQGGCPTILRMPLVPDPMPNKTPILSSALPVLPPPPSVGIEPQAGPINHIRVQRVGWPRLINDLGPINFRGPYYSKAARPEMEPYYSKANKLYLDRSRSRERDHESNLYHGWSYSM